MKQPITQLTKKDVQALCRKPYCTNSKLINVTEQEVKEMKAWKPFTREKFK